MEYIRKVSEEYTYQYEDPKIGKVELWDFSKANTCEESRIEAVTTVASITHGNERAEDPEKLYNLLIEKGYESAFEFIRYRFINFRESVMSYSDMPLNEIATFKLKVPIFVARQIMRQRSFSYVEMNRRIVQEDKVDFDFWTPESNYKQQLMASIDNAMHTREMLLLTCKPEQAISFLPLGLYTEFWMQGDYRAFTNFFVNNLSPETQDETRSVVENMFHLLMNYQFEFIETISRNLKEWVIECNKILRPNRNKRASIFREKYIETYKKLLTNDN